jgi:hypothetical protein
MRRVHFLVYSGAAIEVSRLLALFARRAAHTRKSKSALDKFWQEVEQRGTPLIEPIEGDDKNLLVTFLWRATFEIWNVLVVWRYGIG